MDWLLALIIVDEEDRHGRNEQEQQELENWAHQAIQRAAEVDPEVADALRAQGFQWEDK